MALPFPGSNPNTQPFALTGSTAQTILTCPTSGNQWYNLTALRISIGTGSPGTAKIVWHQSASNTDFVLNDQAPFSAGYPYDEEYMPLHIEPGDTIKVTGTTGNHVFISYDIGNRAPKNQIAPGQGMPQFGRPKAS